MEQKVKKLFENKDYEGIKKVLEQNSRLANEGIPYDEVNTTKAHPLHRICDEVSSGKITDDEAVEIAKIFLEHGANVNGYELIEKRDTPLIAAASLHADKVAILYIGHGANIYHAGCHGGTALHWAAWCGRDKVVRRLIKEGAEINKRCIDFKATPLFWAVHGLKNSGEVNMHNQFECIKILLDAGADKDITNCDGHMPIDLLSEEDVELRELLS
jgi:ankyrin repeat protein